MADMAGWKKKNLMMKYSEWRFLDSRKITELNGPWLPACHVWLPDVMYFHVILIGESAILAARKKRVKRYEQIWTDALNQWICFQNRWLSGCSSSNSDKFWWFRFHKLKEIHQNLPRPVFWQTTPDIECLLPSNEKLSWVAPKFRDTKPINFLMHPLQVHSTLPKLDCKQD